MNLLSNNGVYWLIIIIFIPVILGILSKMFKSQALDVLHKLTSKYYILILGLFVLYRAILLYTTNGNRLIIGDNVAPLALSISGGVLSLVGIWIIFKKN